MNSALPDDIEQLKALLVAQQEGLPTASTATAQVLYCARVEVDVGKLFP